MNAKISGLTSTEVLSARAQFGSNILEKSKTKGILGKFFENLSDF